MDKNYKIIKDDVYGYLRLDPIPTENEVNEYYKKEFYNENHNKFNDSSYEVQNEEKGFFNRRWELVHQTVHEYFSENRELSLFDVGFGYAQALLYFRDKGIKVSGLEPSPEGVKYAKSKNLNVYEASIEDFSCVGNERFDIVTLFNVLEHLRNPANTLLKIKEKVLKKQGLLVIDVPNEFNDFQTTADAEYNLNQWWISPPAHINYFSATSLKNLLKKCGYNIIHCEASFPLELFLLMGDTYVGNNDLGKICHKKREKFEYLMIKYGKQKKLREFYKCLSELDLGRQIILYASPKQE
jgi:SAM-dependent methyltransferase